MIETVNSVLHNVFQVFEIEQEAGLVEFGAGKGHTNLVIVAVRVLALALVVPQVVSCRECVIDCDFVHESSEPRLLPASVFIVPFESLGFTART